MGKKSKNIYKNKRTLTSEKLDHELDRLQGVCCDLKDTVSSVEEILRVLDTQFNRILDGDSRKNIANQVSEQVDLCYDLIDRFDSIKNDLRESTNSFEDINSEFIELKEFN